MNDKAAQIESRACDLYTVKSLFKLSDELKGKEKARAQKGAESYAKMIGKERSTNKLTDDDEKLAAQLAHLLQTNKAATIEEYNHVDEKGNLTIRYRIVEPSPVYVEPSEAVRNYDARSKADQEAREATAKRQREVSESQSAAYAAIAEEARRADEAAQLAAGVQREIDRGNLPPAPTMPAPVSVEITDEQWMEAARNIEEGGKPKEGGKEPEGLKKNPAPSNGPATVKEYEHETPTEKTIREAVAACLAAGGTVELVGVWHWFSLPYAAKDAREIVKASGAFYSNARKSWYIKPNNQPRAGRPGRKAPKECHDWTTIKSPEEVRA